MSRIVATGLATAAGAVITSLVDSRGTLLGAAVVAMTVSAIGQAMRVPLDRLERRVKSLGMVRGMLLLGLIVVVVATSAVGARDILQGNPLGARIVSKLQLGSTDKLVRLAPTPAATEDEDAPAPTAVPAARPTASAEKTTSTAEKERKAQPAPAHEAERLPSGPDQP
jgi:hypothetical protein